MLTPQQALIIGGVVSPIILVVIAFFTRASKRRFVGALVGAVAYGVLNFALDRLAFAAGWWQYPAWASSGQLLFLYIPAGIVGGAFGLIGWRVMRRFSWRGLIGFLLVWSVWGVIHDVGGSAAFASSNFMVFGSGIVPLLADVAVFAACGAVAQVAIWLVAGPPHADRLARIRNPAEGAQRLNELSRQDYTDR